jgi:hypothetical protein
MVSSVDALVGFYKLLAEKSLIIYQLLLLIPVNCLGRSELFYNQHLPAYTLHIDVL